MWHNENSLSVLDIFLYAFVLLCLRLDRETNIGFVLILNTMYDCFFYFMNFVPKNILEFIVKVPEQLLLL